ncbi:MAG: zinc ABC transporter substrate-binding protein [Clostridia bacterium]|nr:zinc ABC transporter substrate-binding protein [Clostridia bacterium]
MKKAVRLLALLLLLLTALPLLSACGEGDDRPVVAVTILPEAGLVRAVAGEDFRILTLVPPGYSPEAYEPTVRTMAEFSRAALFFSIGVPVEETALLPSLGEGTRHVSLSAAAAAVYPELVLNGERDPHVWLSPKRVAVMVARITEELSALRPEQAEVYRQNAAAYLAELSAVDARIRTALSAAGTTDILVYHPAFGYLADEYGLTMHALERDGREPTAAELAEAVDLARERGIRTVFYQAETDGRSARAFAEEIGGRAVMLSPLSEAYLENLEAMAEAIATAERSAP